MHYIYRSATSIIVMPAPVSVPFESSYTLYMEFYRGTQ